MFEDKPEERSGIPATFIEFTALANAIGRSMELRTREGKLGFLEPISPSAKIVKYRLAEGSLIVEVDCELPEGGRIQWVAFRAGNDFGTVNFISKSGEADSRRVNKAEFLEDLAAALTVH